MVNYVIWNTFRYIQMLKNRIATIEWNKDFGEHVIMQDGYDGSAEVNFYPTLLVSFASDASIQFVHFV